MKSAQDAAPEKDVNTPGRLSNLETQVYTLNAAVKRMFGRMQSASATSGSSESASGEIAAVKRDIAALSERLDQIAAKSPASEDMLGKMEAIQKGLQDVLETLANQ